MFKTVEECTNFIFNLKAISHKGEPLAAMREILAHVSNPHEKIKTIHLAGSNGKGSTLNGIREMLDEAGYRVGAFISPHLERVNERITISGVQITDEQFLAYANQVFNVIETHQNGQFPSFFEIITLIAFMHFAAENVDVALMETGIGGRLDSTNVITPLVSIITTISLEHTAILGDTYAKIAFEKAGIIKPSVPVITGVSNADALEVIHNVAQERNAPLFVLGKDFIVNRKGHGEKDHQSFDYKLGNLELNNVQLRMAGAHQVANAALAITAAITLRNSGFANLTDQVIRTALVKAQWAGRFEQFEGGLILDGAHNSEGTAALIETLQSVYPGARYHFIYAALADKDHVNSITMMDEVAASMSFTEISLPNAMPAKKLVELSKHPEKSHSKVWQSVIDTKIKTKDDNDILVITGSLYFIAEVRSYLMLKRGELR